LTGKERCKLQCQRLIRHATTDLTDIKRITRAIDTTNYTHDLSKELEEMDKFILVNTKRARLVWLMPVILSIWEAEIRRIMVPGQPRQKVCETHLIKKKKKLRRLAHAYHPSNCMKNKIRG
jgi:hypothetical protein